jgi:hypothetical protein
MISPSILLSPVRNTLIRPGQGLLAQAEAPLDRIFELHPSGATHFPM